MRTIAKGAEPQALLNWKRDNQATLQDLTYRGGGFPLEAVRQALLAEQFHLCAYTMKALMTAAQCQAKALDTGHACHVEHLLPQARNVAAETIDFQNMLACFPSSQSDTACPYGAQAKADYGPGINPFVSPLSAGAAQHFKFFRDGTVESDTTVGKETIKVLCLNHGVLRDDRAAAIKGYLEPKTGRPISAEAARRLARHIQQPDTQNRLPAHCTAIAQAALDHAERAERRAARLKKKP